MFSFIHSSTVHNQKDPELIAGSSDDIKYINAQLRQTTLWNW